MIWAGRWEGIPGTASKVPDAELKVYVLRKSLKPRGCGSSTSWSCSCTHKSHGSITYHRVSELEYSVKICHSRSADAEMTGACMESYILVANDDLRTLL